MFTVHTDLLCANSTFFRARLQPNRRPIEDDCSICHEEVRLGHKETTFCRSCGVNFHYHCIEQWKARAAEGEVATCPLCRQEWLEHRTVQQFLSASCSEVTFAVYVEWLYRGHIALENDESLGRIIHAYFVGLLIEDWKFCDTLLEAYVEVCTEHESRPSGKLLTFVYANTPGPCRLRRFLVEMFMRREPTTWIEDESWSTLPPAFTRDVAMAALKKNPADNESWNEDTLKVRLCIPGGHTGEGNNHQAARADNEDIVEDDGE